MRLGSIQGTLAPQTKPRRLIVFAGDHGVVNDGVGIWPQAVTGAMIGIDRGGRASCSALAAGVRYERDACRRGIGDGCVTG